MIPLRIKFREASVVRTRLAAMVMATIMVFSIFAVGPTTAALTVEPDRFEPNNWFGSATPITPGTYSDLTIAHLVSEYDFYQIQLNPGDTLEVWTHSSSSYSGFGIDVSLADSPENYVSGSFNPGNSEYLVYSSPTGGSYYIIVFTNEYISGSYTLTVAVNGETVSTNQPPEANAGLDQVVNEHDLVTLNATASFDPNSDPITYQWTQTDGVQFDDDGTTLQLNDPTSATPSFTAPAARTEQILAFQVKVTDDSGASDTDTVQVTVQPVNEPPVADAGPDRIVYEGDSGPLDGGSSFDPDGDPITYLWAQISGPTVQIIDSTEELAWVHPPTIVETEQVLTFQLEVTDDSGESDTDTVQMTFIPVNEPPTAAFTHSPSNPEVDRRVEFDAGDSFDSDGTLISYAWAFGDGDTASGMTPTHIYEAEGTFEVTLTVTDNEGASTTVTQPVTVLVFANPLVVDGAEYTPNDSDSDGLYEDINGDGVAASNGQEKAEDISTLAKIIEAYQDGSLTLTQAQIEALDFNGDNQLSGADTGAYASS